ncbi:MAG TPA: LPS assembly protein LptD, partial [Dokdonella sp.]
MRPTLDRLPGRRLLPIAILQVLLPAAPAAWAAQGIEVAPPSCTAGTAGCAARPLDWGMCGKNDLLDFHVADLPTEGDRDSVARDVSALKVSSPDNSRYVLEGKAEIRQLDLLLRAEKITYDADTSDYTAQGPITYQDRGLLLAADAASGNADRDQCTLEGVRYQLLGSRGNGVASVAITTDIDHARLTGATFSTCDVANQQWAFAAREIELDRVEGIGRARDVTFRVRNVPVFWLPYARFPLDDRRVSGFLFPNVGFSDRRGFDLTLPYYFNIAPNYDATLAPRLMTERGLMLGGEFRYLAVASSGTFNFEFLPDDRRADDEAREYGENIPDSRWWYQWRDTTRFNQTWGANVDLNRVSDARYFEDFGRGLYSSAVSFLPSRAYVHGRGESWSASIGGDDYQITDPTLPERFEPYRRLPRATFDAERALLGPLEGGIDAEFVAFAKDDAVDGRRLDLYPHLSLRLEGAAWFLKPELGYRYTRYELEDLDEADNPLLGSDDPHRGTPIFSLDGGLVFERELEFGGEAWTQTFEPRAYYLRVPYRDQGDIPLFDTQQIPFTFSELFRSNRFVGADRQMDANNLSLALTTRFLENATG